MTWCNHFEAPALQKPHPKGPLVHKVQQYLKGDNRSVFKVLAFSCTLLIMAVHYLCRRARYGPVKPIYRAGQWPGRRSDFTQKSGLRTGEGHDVSLDEVPQGGHCLDANHSLRLTLLELKLASPRCNAISCPVKWPKHIFLKYDCLEHGTSNFFVPGRPLQKIMCCSHFWVNHCLQRLERISRWLRNYLAPRGTNVISTTA